MSAEDCYSCEMDARVPDVPPREAIEVGDHWRLAHAFNSALPGWLVALPRRHVTGLHQLSAQEVEPLSSLLHRASCALVEVTDCLKAYVMFFAEAPKHEHVHFHIVPRMSGWDEDVRGPGVFHFLSRPEEEWVTEEARDKLAVRIRGAL